jgi:TonB family protein
MSSATWDMTQRSDRNRERLSLLASMLLHASLLAWLILFPPHAAPRETLTEVTLLDAGEAGAAEAAPAAAVRAAETSTGAAAVTSDRSAHFERATERADVAPQPQDISTVSDRLAARLATLRSTTVAPTTGIPSTNPTSLWGSTPATLPSTGGGGASPIALVRGGTGAGPSLMLHRGSGGGPSTTLATAAMAPEHHDAPPAPDAGDATLRRSLAGATLMGPIADRRILAQVKPAYPDWAMREAVEGSVTLYFIVRPDGSVRENVLVQKTAGFEDFDENARSAIRAWRFQALGEGRTGDQWGTITFQFRLREGG